MLSYFFHHPIQLIAVGLVIWFAGTQIIVWWATRGLDHERRRRPY